MVDFEGSGILLEMSNFAVYVHIPFCRHRCAYCDFNTYAGIEDSIPAYVEALCREIEYLSRYERVDRVQSIYFGGGTPSLLPSDIIKRLMAALKDGFSVDDGAEMTIEANPGTLTLNYLKEIRKTGINRLSLGMQSANPDELHLLEREHDYIDVVNAISWGHRAGFDNINLDLIYGLPNQSLVEWQKNLFRALDLHPEHVSIYALGLEEGTPMYRWVDRGLLNSPDPDLAADMYEWGSNVLEEAGYYPYEISSWAKMSREGRYECRHNLQYWRNQPYLGIGAGAHGFAGGLRVANVKSPFEYMERLSEEKYTGVIHRITDFPRTPASGHVKTINLQVEMGETMMLGLRLLEEGISMERFNRRFDRSMDEVFGEKIDLLLEKELVEWDSEKARKLRLSKKGRLLGNQAFVEFV